jgi:hypothetical protein
MLSPNLVGSEVERRARELRAMPATSRVIREKIPRQRRSRRRLRVAFGTWLIAWGEWFTAGIGDAQIERFGGQPC